MDQLSLTRLLWVLTPAPPHKQGQPITALSHRLAMLRLALMDEPRFELSPLEMERPGPHYTLDTLRILSERHPDAELVLLLGGDSLRDLPTWHRPAELVGLCRELGVMRRPDDEVDLQALEDALPGVAGKVRFVDAPLLEISSREIRRRIAEGRSFRYYLLPQVYAYIQSHHLYRTFP